ncbi:MAG: CinA family protein [Mariprofundaceae bacterium]|nr:CinA family protein [Mariprofundaceae bacterium]
MQAELIVSELGRDALMRSGLSCGWLRAWICSMGAKSVRIRALQDGCWKRSTASWQIFYGTEDELIRVALKHQRKITMTQDFKRSISGAKRIDITNPTRFCWTYHYTHAVVVLLSLGDISSQRDKWLKCLSTKKRSMHIAAHNQGDITLELGLSADIYKKKTDYLNHSGDLLEEQIYALLLAKGLKLRTAESCTGGAIAQRLTHLSGASNIFDCTWVTYSNQAKINLLNIEKHGLEKHGAVSASIVEAMARAGMDHDHICIAVSGIAGPTGGSTQKPIGTVWLAIAMQDGRCHTELLQLSGSRADIQHQVVIKAFSSLIHRLQN